jgi:hypothetical protein
LCPHQKLRAIDYNNGQRFREGMFAFTTAFSLPWYAVVGPKRRPTSTEASSLCDKAGPTSLMARPDPGAVVPVEVLVEENVVAPVRVVLEERDAGRQVV